MSTTVRDVDTSQFPTEVLARSHQVPVVVDFWAAWCGPCRVLGPILERAAARAEGAWELVKVDVDRNQELSVQFGVQGIPTVIGFRDGEPVARFTGALPEASVDQWLRQLVPSANDRLVAEAESSIGSGDTERAEETLQKVLANEPGHEKAGLVLARMLIDTARADEALTVLERFPARGEAERLQSMARMRQGEGNLAELETKVAAAPDDSSARLALGRALAAAGRNRDALEHLLVVVQSQEEDSSDAARRAMLDLFELVEDEALVTEYRKRLANSLF